MSKPAIEKIEQQLYQDLADDKLAMPSLPEVALEIKHAAEDPDASLMELCDIVGKDAALSGKLIQIANSPMYRGAKPTESLNMAVNRLGLSSTANIAMGVAMAQMFQATSDNVDQWMRQVWQQSSEISALSHVLTKHYTKLKPDMALLAGLTHKIGVLPILHFAESHPHLIQDNIMLTQVIEHVHPKLGAKILEAWHFPQELRHVPAEHVNFQRKIDNVDYADIVMVAYLESIEDDNHPHLQLPFDSVTAFERVGIIPSHFEDEIEDLSDDMEAAMAMLAA